MKRVGGSVLSEILDAKRRRLAAGEYTAARGAAASFAATAAPSPRAPAPGARPDGARFAAALSPSSSPSFLCEIKHRSPSAGVILPDADARVEETARAYRRGGAAALSVVVEQDFFGGTPPGSPGRRTRPGSPFS